MKEEHSFDIRQAAANLEISLDLYKRLARLFLDDTEVQLKHMNTALGQENAAEIARIAHHIAGSAENLDLPALGRTARRLMDEAESSETTESVHRHYQELERTFRDIQQELETSL